MGETLNFESRNRAGTTPKKYMLVVTEPARQGGSSVLRDSFHL